MQGDIADPQRPRVARRALRFATVQRDRTGGEGHPHRALRGVGRHEDRTGVGPGVALRVTRRRVEVEADHGGDVGAAGLAEDLAGGAGLGHPAVLDEDEAVGEGQGVEGVVGHEHGHAVVGGQPRGEVAAGPGPGLRVQGRQRLVEEQERRVGRQGTGQRHPGGLAGGELPRPGLGLGAESDPLELGERPSAGGRTPDAAAAQPVGHVLHRRQVGEEERVGEHQADVSPVGGPSHAALVPRRAVDADPAVRAGEHAGQRQHRRRLAPAVRPEHADDLAGAGRERHVEVQGAAGEPDPRVQPDPHRSHRPRRTPSTRTLTASSTMLTEIATCGSCSSAA